MSSNFYNNENSKILKREGGHLPILVPLEFALD